MDNKEEDIEILDDFEEDTLIIPPITKDMINDYKESEMVSQNNNISVQPEVITVDNNVPIEQKSNNDLGENHNEAYHEVKNLDDIHYEPIKPEKQEIKIDTDPTDDNSKSGLGFIIVLFILLVAFIIALPYISKLF